MDKEEVDKKATNAEYLPIKCRITRPAPPKPATNPLQFVKVGPCPLYKKAQEQLKKVEEVKVIRQEIREEAEDWQHNLDNWKSSRRKRQEHIIERVEEVKKIEQEQYQSSRRRTTFNEILEKRRGSRFSIPIYDDDTNDLSDYGISTWKTKCSESSDDDKSKNSASEAETIAPEPKAPEPPKPAQISPTKPELKPKPKEIPINGSVEKPVAEEPKDIEQYTYEGAIQNYRSRIKNKINLNESIFTKAPEVTASKEYTEAQTLVPKGNLFKRKEIFENERTSVEIQPFESKVVHKISEDFVNTQSIKQRLESLEKCSEQLIKSNGTKTEEPKVNKLKSSYLESKGDWNSSKSDIYERYSSTDEDCYVDKRDIDVLYPKSVSDNCLRDFITSPYPPSTSSTDLVVLSSDREDSGIHTADVSCSVSQSDEAFEDIDMSTNTIPCCIEKLNNEKNTKEQVDDVASQQAKTQTLDFLQHEQEFASQLAVDHSSIEEVPLADEELFVDSLIPKPYLQPPTVKPPPPPPMDSEEVSPMQIKKELHKKRSSFLGLMDTGEFDPSLLLDKPPDVNVFLQNESRNEKHFYKQLHASRESCLNEVSSQDSGFGAERTRLDSGRNGSLDDDVSHARQDSDLSTGISLEEDEIMKKEREIIELVEQEEKSKDHDFKSTNQTSYFNPIDTYEKRNSHSGDELGSKKFERPYFIDSNFDNIDEQDSEVLKVEHELLQLEREELERQRENMLYHEKSLKLKQHHLNYDNVNYCKSMPELQHPPPLEYKPHFSNYPLICEGNTGQYCKSMPDIQHAYNRSVNDYYRMKPSNSFEHRKSNPDFKPAFKTPPTIPDKPIKLCDADKEIPMRLNHFEMELPYVPKQPKYTSRQMSHPSSVASRIRHSDNWKQPKLNPEVKSYDQHWLFQEAELRRLSDQNNLTSRTFMDKDMRLPYKQKNFKSYPDRNPPPPLRVSDPYIPKNQAYIGQSQTGHALPMSYKSSTGIDDGQDIILSVSGKKKCSYCGNELGRGAAMIIETLGLFYHMECFKCCVCHVELGDGLMGTDVRVRNQKLHCHNCYSSDDGVKFSCV